jgi:nitroreductase
MRDEALKLALEALEEIALAGMSGTGQESDEAMTNWHARQAWKFIGIAARALEPIKQARSAPVQPVAHIVGEIDHNGKVWTPAQTAVPDAFGTREGEHPQYVQGWNDCRAEMLKGMKP